MLEYTEVECFVGKALKVSNGHVEFTVPLEVGPRIIGLNKTGSVNLFYNDTERRVTKDVSRIYGAGKEWRIYGGHRLWLSPEDDATYYPDNEAVSVTRMPDGISVSGPRQDKTNLTVSIDVNFINENELRVTHRFVNGGPPRRLCLWGLTVLKAGGKLELFFDDRDTGYLPSRNLVLWPYTDIHDGRLQIFNNKLVIKSTDKVSKPLKFGTYRDEIKAVYTIGSQVFTKLFYGEPDGEYPDFHCNFECYISNYIHEIESLSAIKSVPEGGAVEMSEIWRID